MVAWRLRLDIQLNWPRVEELIFNQSSQISFYCHIPLVFFGFQVFNIFSSECGRTNQQFSTLKMFKSFNLVHFGTVQPPSAGHRRQLLWACRPGIKGWGTSSWAADSSWLREFHSVKLDSNSWITEKWWMTFYIISWLPVVSVTTLPDHPQKACSKVPPVSGESRDGTSICPAESDLAPKFNSSPLKIYHPKRKGPSSNHHFFTGYVKLQGYRWLGCSPSQ